MNQSQKKFEGLTINLVFENERIFTLNRHTYEVLIIMLSEWDFVYLEKNGQLIHDAIKKGLSDADAEARSHARKAFGLFREHFPSLADILLASLDSVKKKALMVSEKSSSRSYFIDESIS